MVLIHKATPGFYVERVIQYLMIVLAVTMLVLPIAL